MQGKLLERYRILQREVLNESLGTIPGQSASKATLSLTDLQAGCWVACSSLLWEALLWPRVVKSGKEVDSIPKHQSDVLLNSYCVLFKFIITYSF